MIISGEDKSILSDNEKYRLIDYFVSKGIKVKIIAFVRKPQHFALSMMQESIKHGATSIDCFNPWYSSCLSAFDTPTIREITQVIDFDETVRKYGNIVTGFFKINDLKLSNVKDKYVNASLSESSIKIIFRLNKLLKFLPLTSTTSEARHHFAYLLNQFYPKTTSDSLSIEHASLIIDENAKSECNYLHEKHNIGYELGPINFNIAGIERILSDLKSIDTAPLHQLLDKRYNKTISKNLNIDDIILFAFKLCLSEYEK